MCLVSFSSLFREKGGKREKKKKKKKKKKERKRRREKKKRKEEGKRRREKKKGKEEGRKKEGKTAARWRKKVFFANLYFICRPRPHLLARLNDTLPITCSSCARRFEDSAKGKKEKRAHLDWHFRVHQRMLESAKRGQNRSWYVGEEVRIALQPCERNVNRRRILTYIRIGSNRAMTPKTS